MCEAREAALAAFREALAALDARRLTAEAAAGLDFGGRARVLAVGKAAAAMAAGAADALGSRIARTLVVSKDEPGPRPARGALCHAGHPVPDLRSLRAGLRLLGWARRARADQTVLVLVSGGASALATVPAFAVPLGDKIAVTGALAAAGAPIGELNVVRKHLSRIKGGRLALAGRGRISALILSDVVGDDPASIGSGPVSPDPSCFADAAAILVRWGVRPPDSVARALARGAAGDFAETPKPGHPRLAQVTARVLAGPAELGRAAAAALAGAGFAVAGVELAIGDAAALGAQLAEHARRLAAEVAPGQRLAWVASGEPTLALPGAVGRGGRAQHCALVAARGLAPAGPERGRARVAILCAASDGSDGPGQDAGGLVDCGTVARAAAAGVPVDPALARFDSGAALAAAGDLVTTGPTGRNLCDLFIVTALG